MDPKAAASIPGDHIDILSNRDIDEFRFHDGSSVKVREVTSVNLTKMTVRFIPRQGSAMTIPIADIKEIFGV